LIYTKQTHAQNLTLTFQPNINSLLTTKQTLTPLLTKTTNSNMNSNHHTKANTTINTPAVEGQLWGHYGTRQCPDR